MESFNGTYCLFDVPVVKVDQEQMLLSLVLEKKGNDGYLTGASGQAPSNINLEELSIWSDCWWESLPSLLNHHT